MKQASKALLVCKVRRETLVYRESKAFRARKAPRVPEVRRVSKDSKESKARKVRLETLDLKVYEDLPGPKETLDRRETPDR